MDPLPNLRNVAVNVTADVLVQAGTIHNLTTSQAVSGRVSLPKPQQLPPTIRDFVGRDEYLAALDSLLFNGRNGVSIGASTIAILAGMAGVGKTTLAVHWARRTAERFPDGVLFANVRGYGPSDAAAPTEIMEGFLRALGVTVEQMPARIDEQAGLFRSLTAEKKILVLIDNVSSAGQVRPLLPAAPGCFAIVTSRDSLTGLVAVEGAEKITVDVLTPSEALTLATGILGTDRAAEQPNSVENLVRLCARLPLALRIAATQAADTCVSLLDVVAELAADDHRLRVLSQSGDERTEIRAVFDWSYRRLEPSQARLFRCLGLHPGPEFSLSAAATIANSDRSATRLLMNCLIKSHMVERVDSKRYRMHDLLRDYAANLAVEHEAEVDREHILITLLEFYVQTLYQCDRIIYVAHEKLPRPMNLKFSQEMIEDRDDALTWLRHERVNLIAMLKFAALRHRHDEAIHLAYGMRFLCETGGWDDLLEATSIGITAARNCGDKYSEAFLHNLRGEVYLRIRDWGKALVEFQCSLGDVKADGNRVYHTWSLINLGYLYCEMNNFERALLYLTEALSVVDGSAPDRLVAVLEGNLCRAYTGLGSYRPALRHGERALMFRRRIAAPEGEPIALWHLAEAWQGLGEHAKAIELCRRAINISRMRTQCDVTATIAPSLSVLASSLSHVGSVAEALQCWDEAASIYEENGQPQVAIETRQLRDKAMRRISSGM